MFCRKCGAGIPDDSVFCPKCGEKTEASVMDSSNNINNIPATKFVPAKCTNCGGTLQVDPSERTAECPFCNSLFLVEQAINNFNIQMNGNLNIGTASINVNGLSTESLLARAREFEQNKEYETALSYYNKVLDIDFNNSIAKEGFSRVDDILHPKGDPYFGLSGKKIANTTTTGSSGCFWAFAVVFCIVFLIFVTMALL